MAASRWWWRAIIVYGIVNAAAYSCLLALWEGFDEGYHYGYVQALSTHPEFPVLGRAFLSREVWRSYELTPVSHYLQAFTKAPVNFGDYFAMGAGQRERLRKELDAIPGAWRFQPQLDKPNYEVNQSPLPYVFMSMIDRSLNGTALTTRVLWLRLICSALAVLLIAHSFGLLAGELGLAGVYRDAALFCVFSSQMLYATVCHVCNDWLAVPAMVYLVYCTVRAWRTGGGRDWSATGAVLAIGLLTKAYFLFMVPLPVVVLGMALWRGKTRLREAVGVLAGVLALPWYARNMALYGNWSGTVESTSGLGPREMWHAALTLPWRESVAYMAHASLWTGNNSFTTFSALTLDAMLALLAGAALLFFWRWRWNAAEWITVAAVVLFSCGLAVVSVTFYASSKGGAIAAVPWYMQVLLPLVMALAFAGMARMQAWRRWLLCAFVALWAYVMVSTYLVKLGPMYGGLGGSAAHPAALARWYWAGTGEWSNVCLGGAAAAWTLIACAAMLALGLAAGLSMRDRESQA